MIVWRLDSDMVLVKSHNVEEGCSKQNTIALPKFVTLRKIIVRSETFRDFSIVVLVTENLKHEVQETESAWAQQCL